MSKEKKLHKPRKAEAETEQLRTHINEALTKLRGVLDPRGERDSGIVGAEVVVVFRIMHQFFFQVFEEMFTEEGVLREGPVPVPNCATCGHPYDDHAGYGKDCLFISGGFDARCPADCKKYEEPK